VDIKVIRKDPGDIWNNRLLNITKLIVAITSLILAISQLMK